MQLRVPFPNRANAFLRNPTSLTSYSCCMYSIVRGIGTRHGPRILHYMAMKGSYNVWTLRSRKRHWCVVRTLNSKYNTTGRTCFQEVFSSKRMSHESTQPADIVSMLDTVREPSIDSNVGKSEAELPDMRRQKKTVKVRYFTSERGSSRAIGRVTISRRKIQRPSRANLCPNPLEAWLDSRSRPERAAICEKQARKHMHDSRGPSLSTVLLFHLEMRETLTLGKESLLNTLVVSALPSLKKRGFFAEDLFIWGDIVTAPTDEEVVQRYLSCQSVKPAFILLEILRRPRLEVKSFCSLLVHSYHLLQTSAGPRLNDSEPDSGPENIPDRCPLQIPSFKSTRKQNVNPLQLNAFMVLLCRLLLHSRRVWPAAMITISDMVVSYCQRLVDGQFDVFTRRVYRRLCRIHNLILHRLSLPASANPLRSMEYNWQAQRIILASAASFQPPLQISKTSYRAVAQVLLASGKSPTESRHASLLQKTWPPWRRELHGMDVKRSPNTDISRVVAVLSRMREAGYAHEAVDRAIKVLGGREPDGTPTIQTRRLIKIRRSHLNEARPVVDGKPDDCTVEWAARITATRDVHEAWNAFQGFTRDGQRPSHSMYYAMFEKLIYRTLTDMERQDRVPVAGDAREALPVIDDNISASEKLRMQPPTIESLFSRMIADKIRPSGRFLEMLVANARSLEILALYMKHGAIRYKKFIELLRKPDSMSASALKSIPDTIFDAFIRFLCRQRDQPITDPSEFLDREQSIVRFKHHSDPIIHAFQLVKHRQPASRNVWYTIIRSAARPGFIFDPNLNQYMNDVLSWRFIEAIIRSSLKAGFQFDTDGFGRVCLGLEKALRARDHVSEKAASIIREGPETIKETFAKLSESVDASLAESMEDGDALPKMLYDFAGYQLHRYIRVLCLTSDIDEIISVLRWMVKHKEELGIYSIHFKHGSTSLRRTLVAVRALLGWTGVDEKVSERLRDAMEQLDGPWGGWPTGEEVETYLSHKTQEDNEGQQGILEHSI